MNGMICDECGTGYKPGMVEDCPNKCGKEFCVDCLYNHGCEY